jgi:hypothetical protein
MKPAEELYGVYICIPTYYGGTVYILCYVMLVGVVVITVYTNFQTTG